MAKHGALIMILLVIAVAIAAFLYQQRHPREIVGQGSVTVESAARPGTRATLQTRTVKVGPTQFQEVRLPNGTWIGCAGDCRKAALDAGPDFWDALNRKQSQ